MSTLSTRSTVDASRAFRRMESGVTLLEILVALTISLIVLFAVVSVYAPTKQNTRLQAGVSRANETAQISAELLAREIRHTAHIGCPALGDPSRGLHRLSTDSLTAADPGNTFSLAGTTAVRVLATGSADAPSAAKTGTAIIDITHGANDGVHLLAKMTDRGDAMVVTGDPGMTAATPTASNGLPLAFITDCANAEAFKVSGVLQNPWRVVPLDKLRTLYSRDSRVMPGTRTQFFVGDYDRPTGERDSVAIYSRTIRRDGVNWNTAQPVAHDIESMQVTMHLDTDADFQADTQVPFGSAYDPAQVVGLTLLLTFQTPEGVLGTAGVRVKRPYTTAINIRSRVS